MFKRIACIFLVFLCISTPLCVCASSFSDVADTAWYSDAVEFCHANGIMQGMGNSSFAPKGNATREQMIVVLANIKGSDTTAYTERSFTDVPLGRWYSCYIAWAKAEGYTQGVGNGLFGLGRLITREEAVTMLYNYIVKEGFTPADGGSLEGFSDAAAVSPWAKEAIEWAVGASVMAGSDNRLDPKSNITRAQLAQLLMTLYYNVIYADCEHEFSTADCYNASVCAKCGIIRTPALGHSYDKEPNCTDGAYCLRCRSFAPPTGHIYTAATCTQPALCTECGHIAAKALGHTTSNGVCSRCGTEIFKSQLDKLEYYITQYGIKHNTERYYASNISYTSGDYAYQYLWFDTQNKNITLENNYHFKGSKDYIKTTISFVAGGAAYSYTAVYYQGENVLCSAKGSITPKGFSPALAFTLSGYEGDDHYKSAFSTLTHRGLCYNINGAADLLRAYTGLDISVLGF